MAGGFLISQVVTIVFLTLSVMQLKGKSWIFNHRCPRQYKLKAKRYSPIRGHPIHKLQNLSNYEYGSLFARLLYPCSTYHTACSTRIQISEISLGCSGYLFFRPSFHERTFQTKKFVRETTCASME